MAARTPNWTTLGVAISDAQRIITLASVSGINVNDKLVVGAEILIVRKVSSTASQVTVRRGAEGTAARKHPVGAPVYIFAANTQPAPRYDKERQRVVVGGYDGYLPAPALPIGLLEYDDFGNEYMLVDCSKGFVVGEWVVIDHQGLASQLAANSKGRVGIVVEPVDQSDTLAYVLRRGSFASALFDSDVTTAMELGAAAGYAAPFDSSNHVKIERATCIVAPSTATTPTIGDGIGTAYIDRPWVSGIATFVS